MTRKISDGVARIKMGVQDKLHLGNLEARRDWGFAGDYVEAMWLMLQQNEPDDYVVASGQDHSVKDFLQIAFDHAGLKWEDHVVVDKKYIRPAEVDHLLGNSKKARNKLKWEPKVDFKGLVTMMVDADIERVKAEIQSRK